MELINVMEAITLAVTLGMIMTGVVPCKKMYDTKSTKNVPYPIFLLSLISGLGMFHYGLMFGNPVLIFINAVGTVMQIIYISLFILVSSNKSRPVMLLTAAICYNVSLYYYLYFVLNEPGSRADKLGMSSSLINTVMMCLPAIEIIDNVRNKNADGMPYVMLVGGTACSSCWLTYGLMLHDSNIYMPNIPGLAISVSKLYIMFLYGGSKSSEHRD